MPRVGSNYCPAFERACVVQDDRTGRIKCERIRFWPRLAPRRGLDLHRSSRQHISQRGSKIDGAACAGCLVVVLGVICLGVGGKFGLSVGLGKRTLELEQRSI